MSVEKPVAAVIAKMMGSSRPTAETGRRTRLGLAWALAFAAIATASGCTKPLLVSVPGSGPASLTEDEALLVIDVDTDMPIERIDAQSAIAATNLPKGEHTWVVKAPVGKYRWQSVSFGANAGRAMTVVLDASDDEFAFEVVAGVLNYPGELIIRSDDSGRSAGKGIWIRNRNRAAMAIRALRKTHTELVDSVDLRHAGSSDDSFLEHYTEARASHDSVEPEPNVIRNSDDQAGARATHSGVSAETLYSGDGISEVIVSPNGHWALASAHSGRAHGLLLQRLGSHQLKRVITVENPLISTVWIGPETFLASFNVHGRARTLVGSITEDVLGTQKVKTDWIDAPGWFVDPQPLDAEHVLWEFEEKGKNHLNRVAIDDLVNFKRERSGSYRGSRLGDRLASLKGSISHWIVDRKGEPRAALRRDEEGYTLLATGVGGGSFREIYAFLDTEEERELWPQSLSSDETELLVAAYNGENTLGIVEFDMDQGTFGKTIFRREDVDVTGVVPDFITGELIAVVYEDAGVPRYHYFDSVTSRSLGDLGEQFAKDRVWVVSGSADRAILVLYMSGPTNPGVFYLRDTRSGLMMKAGNLRAWVDRETLVEPETIVVESSDGTKVEAFLTLPSDEMLAVGGPVPLVVNPHGGPIGVRDRRVYDPFVAYLTSWGFAVLQVNYRGSSGYGREFKDAGKREWAQAIEDDIDAAVENVMARPEVDADRLCIVGGSYGGFSALASVVRHKSRYRCAATLNGVTDIPLMFETSDFADYEKVLEQFSVVAGDLEKDRSKLIDLSPAYNVAEMDVPIFVVFGTDDRRVDADHAHRLLLMLETHQKNHDVLEIREAQHSFSSREWVVAVRALRRFLTRHLQPGLEVEPDPALEEPLFELLLKID